MCVREIYGGWYDACCRCLWEPWPEDKWRHISSGLLPLLADKIAGGSKSGRKFLLSGFVGKGVLKMKFREGGEIVFELGRNIYGERTW